MKLCGGIDLHSNKVLLLSLMNTVKHLPLSV